MKKKYMKKKVLFILHLPPPINGAAVVGSLIQESGVINTNFEADYINLATSFSLDHIGKGGVKKIGATLGIIKKVVGALRHKEYDLCYMTLTAKGAGFYKDFLVVCVLKLFGKPIVYHFHNKGVAQSSKRFFNHVLYKMAFKNTKSILLSSLLYKDIEKYVDRKDVFFCANGVPEISGADETGTKPPSSDLCRFIFLSNMMEEKGVWVLLKACRLLKDRHMPFECHFVGAWSDVSEAGFKEKVGELGLGNKVFSHGRQYGDNKIAFLERSDVFVFPTYYHNECFPLVLLEAMQYGLPVVSTYEGGIADIVDDGETGFLISQGSSTELANVLEKLINAPDLRKKMGQAGRARYERYFTIATFERNLTAALKKAMASFEEQ